MTALPPTRPRWRTPVGLPVVVGLAALAAYLFTLSPTTDVADSLELQVVASRLTLAHPPGYPLYTLLGHVFSLLPHADVAWRLNLMSAVAASAAVAATCALALRLGLHPAAAAAGALVLAFERDLWSVAVVTEVYALHLAIVAGLFLAMAVRDAPGVGSRGRRWGLLLTGLSLGLGAAHHLTIVLLVPAVAILLLGDRRWGAPRVEVGGAADGPVGAASSPPAPPPRGAPRDVPVLLGGIALGALPLLYVPWRWVHTGGRPGDWPGMLTYVTATGYGGLLDLAWPLRDPSRLLMLGHELSAQAGTGVLVLALLGLVVLARRRPSWALALGLTWVLFCAFRLGYNAWDGWVILLPAHLATAVLAAVALSAVADRARRSTPARAAAWWLACLAVPATVLSANARAADRSEGWPGASLGARVLSLDLPAGSVIGVEPQLASGLLYQTKVLERRSDVVVALPDTASGGHLIERAEEWPGSVFLLGLVPDTGRGYHLRSLGPLVELGREPRREPPPTATRLATRLEWKEGPTLEAYELARLDGDRYAAVDDLAADDVVAVTLYWRAPAGGSPDRVVALRLLERPDTPALAVGRPVLGHHPTDRWRGGEIVPDYREVAIGAIAPGVRPLQVALAPPDAAGGGLDASAAEWHDLAELRFGPPRRRPSADARRPLSPVTRLVLAGAGPPIDLEDGLQLLDLRAGPVLSPGSRAWVRVGVRATERPRGRYRVSVQLLDAAQERLAGVDRQILHGSRPTDQWLVGEAHVDAFPLDVPADLPPGGYWVRLGLYDQSSGVALAVSELPGRPADDRVLRGVAVAARTKPPDPPGGPVRFADRLELRGVAVDTADARPGGSLSVDLRWHVRAPTDRPMTLFVHLSPASGGAIGAQADGPPLSGVLPSDRWPAGATMDDRLVLPLPDDLPPGPYTLAIGLYDPSDGTRLPTRGGSAAADDHVAMPVEIRRAR